MAKKKVKFEAFLDGVCTVWQLNASKKPVPLLKNLRYQERTVGERRHFDAEQNGHIIQKLLRIPRSDFIKCGMFVTIGNEQYKILQAQKIMDTIPECTDLTLENPGVLLRFDETEAGAGGRI